jgi:hypothetical protein
VGAAHKRREVEWQAGYADFTRAVAYAVSENGCVSCRDGDGVWFGEEVVVDVTAEFGGERQKATVRVRDLRACGCPWGILNTHFEAC